jgi:hypothetical protein
MFLIVNSIMKECLKTNEIDYHFFFLKKQYAFCIMRQ